jgi:hypothetical protein
MSMAELTDRFISRRDRSRTALKTCPHWRSVFSSVFKEPKLGHILAAVFLPAWLGAGPFRRCDDLPWGEEEH